MTKISIVGAGLAGAACAYVLKLRGFEPVIYESGPEIASGASGNSLGLYNPRFTAEKNAESEYFSTAFFLALQTFAQFEDIDFNPCGALHLITNESKRHRFPKTVESWGWGYDGMRVVERQEACTLSGLTIRHDALFLARSGVLSPKKLCAAYTHGIEIKYNSAINVLYALQDEICIISAGMGSLDLIKSMDIPLMLKSVRGQVTHLRSTPKLSKLKCAVCYGGYTTPAINDVHMVGSTFQRWLDHDRILEEDDHDNIEKLKDAVPDIAEEFEVIGHRAAVRTTSPDHFPVVGRLPGQKNTYISTAHGSHGILSSLMAAHVIADMIEGKENALPPETVKKLDPARFV